MRKRLETAKFQDIPGAGGAPGPVCGSAPSPTAKRGTHDDPTLFLRPVPRGRAGAAGSCGVAGWAAGLGRAQRLAERGLAQACDAETIRAVNKGLDYLAAQQAEDGSWITGGGQAYPVAMTGLAGTALLAHGDSPTRGKHSKTVQGAVEYLVRCATPTGLMTGPNQEGGMPMHGHGFALMFLASVYGMITKESLRKQVQVAIRKAVTLTSQGQSAAGGWTYTPGSGDEGSVTVTQVQALRAAHNAGFLVPRAVIEESVKYLEKCRTPEGGIQYSLGSGGGPRLAISAAAVATLYNAGQYEGAIATDCLKYVWDQFRANEGWNKGGGHAFYSHLYAAQGFYMAGDQYWDKYFPGRPRPVAGDAGSRRLVARRRHRRNLRHVDRRDHPAASVQVSAGFSALEKGTRS